MRIRTARTVAILGATALCLMPLMNAGASSHREAPLISNDPVADNTDLYAFRSPDDPNTITIIANYIPMEQPEGGPNWYTFGENVRYEIHVDNDASKPGDELTYRFTFTKTNEDPTTFFNIRLGKQNLKTTYMVEKSTDNGATFTTILTNGIVPPPNIGPRSIEGAAGLGTTYVQLMQQAIANATGNGGEKIFAGPVDDPFFVDLGGIFDLGNPRPSGSDGKTGTRDALAGLNCHAIVLKVPIATLQKTHQPVSAAANILDANYVIGVWASASRPQITTLRTDGGKPDVSGNYVQVSRIGMPLTNEAIIPIGDKDKWNASTPYDRTSEQSYEKYFTNPELGLYIKGGPYGSAVPALNQLNIQTKSLGSYDFRNKAMGLFGLPESARTGTALSDAAFGGFLLRDSAPRSVDLLPIFYTGVPNLAPYQLATGKAGNPLAVGKPFINNFLPTLGDELRLNMAVPVTPRDSKDFSSEGILAAAVLGLTDGRFNSDATLQNIPNMDGFPNGRRLEDDVTRIELQSVGGIVLAAIGLWYDDYTPGGSPVTPMLGNVLTFNAGPEKNDVDFSTTWPYLALPHRGFDYTRNTSAIRDDQGGTSTLGIAAPPGFFVGQNYPNPASVSTSLKFHTSNSGMVTVKVFNLEGREVATLANQQMESGDHTIQWTPTQPIAPGVYVAQLSIGGTVVSSTKVNVVH